MTHLSATEVAREFSAVVNRVGAGEEIEVVRNGTPVMQMRPIRPGHVVAADRWRALLEDLPSPDDDFAKDVEAGREAMGPPAGAWPS